MGKLQISMLASILHLLGKPTAVGRPCYKLASDTSTSSAFITVRQCKLGKVSGILWLCYCKSSCHIQWILASS